MSKNNIIQFPIKRRKEAMLNEVMAETYFEELNIHEDCIRLARFCLSLIDEATLEHYEHEFDMQVPDSDEYRDMFVILNLMVAVFMRNQGQKHILQDDLSEVFAKLMVLQHTQSDDPMYDLGDIVIKEEDDDDIT